MMDSDAESTGSWDSWPDGCGMEVKKTIFWPKAWRDSDCVPVDPLEYVLQYRFLKQVRQSCYFTLPVHVAEELNHDRMAMAKRIDAAVYRWWFFKTLQLELHRRACMPRARRHLVLMRSIRARVYTRQIDKYRVLGAFRCLGSKERCALELRVRAFEAEFIIKGYLLCTKLAGVEYDESADGAREWARERHGGGPSSCHEGNQGTRDSACSAGVP